MVKLEQLTKDYGSFRAVDNVSLHVPKGTLYGFLGPNGAGKTTTLRMIAGILRPTGGRALVGGHDIHRDPILAKAILGFIPDRPFVYDKLTGAEFLRFVAGLYGQEGQLVEKRIDELLEIFELSTWKNELVESYSHGMRQKLIISSALIHRPELIVVDEPMVGLDPRGARLLKDLFRGFVERGGTVLMSTHTLEIAEAMCDRLAIIQGGKIVAAGSMAELRAQHQAGEMGLEDLFLRLTGGAAAKELAAVLVRKQPALAHVLIPKWRTTLTRMRQERDSGGRAKVIVLATVGGIFWLAVFGVLYRVLRYFRNTEEIGALLAGKLLSLALLSFVSVLLLSNVITALSSFFLAKDLDLLVSSPVDWLRIYLAKLLETVVTSSWMVGLMAVPIFTAYGVVYKGGLLFAPFALIAFLPFLVLPAVVGAAVTLILVNVFPARRTRDLLSIIAIGAAAGIVLLFRIIRPEQLARPEGFQNLLDFIAVLRAPTSPWLPSEWVARAVMSYLTSTPDWLSLYLLWTTAALVVAGGAWLHSRLYHTGYTKAQEGAERFVRGGFWDWSLGGLLKPLGAARREFVLKDIRLFFRDTTQWSQLILLAALLVVYLFNIKALPLFRGEQVPFFLVSVVSFLNLGLAGFVLASIAARFIFPAVSLEGRQMWLLRSSPLELKAMMWSKYWVGTLPLLVLALAITILTNVLLKATPFMMAVGIGTILLLTLAISAMALAFGALYPQFETENAAQIPTSFGGLVFMMATIGLLAIVIIIESVPVYGYLSSAYNQQPLVFTPVMAGAFGLAAAVCIGATVIPLRIALRRMETYEF